MNELIPITQSESGENLVDARALHQFLEVRRDFSNWLRYRINQYDFIKDEDYVVCSPDLASLGRNNLQQRIEYGLTLDMAKQLCMVENNERGNQARKYFIECERRMKALTAKPEFRIPQTLGEALQLAADQQKQIEAQEEKIRLDAPKVESFERYMDATGTMSINVVGKILGIGQNKLFKLLREKGVLIDCPPKKGKNGKVIKKYPNHNTPMQEYMDRGWFQVIPGAYDRKGKPGAKYGESHTTRVTTKGLDGINRLLHRQAGQKDLFVGNPRSW